MRILLIASAFNSLSQRIHAELSEAGHELAVVVAACGEQEVRAAVFGPGGPEPAATGPIPDGGASGDAGDASGDAVGAAPTGKAQFDLCIAPMLTTAIPEDVWRAVPCFIVHPGPPGDRGPTSLDWAFHQGADTWGVTVLQAVAEMDAGPVWADAAFPIPRGVSKSEVYRGELADTASRAVSRAVRRFAAGERPSRPSSTVTRGVFPQQLRAIDWAADSTEHVSTLLYAADSSPGVLDRVGGRELYLYGGEPEYALRGRPGTLLATRSGSVCRATADGAVWLTHAKPKRRPGGPIGVKLPAALTLAAQVGHLPECPGSPEITYRERGEVGMLRLSFPGGATGTEQCRRLLHAYRHALSRRTSVLILGGGRGFFGNGIHLGMIDAAADPAAESWANINAIDDVVRAVLRTTDRLVVAAMGGNAAAGGAVLGFAADEVWLRDGTVLNPHYRLMGLYGSEYWTYVLPRRAGEAEAERLMSSALPVGAQRALRLGLADRIVQATPSDFTEAVWAAAFELAAAPGTRSRIELKAKRLEQDEAVRPLEDYRRAELEQMRSIFDDPDAPYHALRSAFVRKTVPEHTPEHLTGMTTAA